MTVQDPVVALALAPISPRFVHVVMVQPDVVQLVPLSARSQRPGLATHPGFAVTVADTTALDANAELFVSTESSAFDIEPLNVTVVQLAASVGTTGIRRVSVPSDAIVVVFVQVTVVPI